MVGIDLGEEVSRGPPTARGLRRGLPPVRAGAIRCGRLEEALGEEELAAEAAAATATAEVRLARRTLRLGAHPRTIAKFGNGARRCASSLRATETPEGALFAEGAPWRFAVAPAGFG